MLARIAELTGGRTLDLAQPQAVELFDRSGMPPSRAALPAWQSLLWMALALLLVDVAARRLAWDALLVRRSVRRATARVEAPEVRGRLAAQTLASLRQVSSQPERRRPTHATSPVAPVAPAAGTPPVVRAVHTVPDGPDPAKVAAALDALLERGSTTTPEPEPPPPESTPDQPPPSETTSNLLAAKRRARRGRK